MNTKTDGWICINRDGQIPAINVDEQNLISYIINKLTHLSVIVRIIVKIAYKYSLFSIDNLFKV